MVRKLLAVIALASVVACHSDKQSTTQAELPRPTVSSVKPEVHRSGELALPDRMRLPSVRYVKAARSWNDRLATLTSSERSRLESLNARYYGLLEFDSAEEQKAMIDAGVPMPEEWLAASSMSDEELATLANARSPKGSMLFADRQLDRFVEAKQRLAEAGIETDFDSDVINSRAQALVYAGQALALTRRPFAAYMYGSIGESLFGEPEYKAAALSVALALGDLQASDYVHEYMAYRKLVQAPPLNFGSVASIEAVMWLHVHRYRPL